jgi:hypothetical protein
MENAKPAIASKTMWINTATLVVGVLGYLMGQELIQDNATLVSILVAVQGAINIGLRFVTTKAIA